MKKLVVILNLGLVFFTSCVTQKTGATSTYSDDVYANPKEDRVIEARLAAEKKQAKDAADKRYNDSIAAVKQAQKEKDDANPYYKDREFKYDDYYDYEYATRVKRFNNNINGLSYYDNYYTNSYWYNKNPYNYGVSVYNGYSWWGSSYNNYSYNPSANFYNSWGWGYGNQFGYNGYNPYMGAYTQGYNNGFNNGCYGNYYGYGNPYSYGNSFGYGMNSYGYGNPYGYGAGYGGYGYNNPYNNNGWGYYNSYDNNSSYTYGPRTSHGGGNSHRTSNPGINSGNDDSYYKKYVNEMAVKQEHTVKFTETPTIRTNSFTNPIRVNNEGVPIGTGGIKQNPNHNSGENNYPVRGYTPSHSGNVNEPVRNNPNYSTPVKNSDESTPVRQNPIKESTPVKQYPTENIPRNETPHIQNNFPAPSMPNNGGGGSAPSGGGGSHRPR
jgi:hypothetical protein